MATYFIGNLIRVSATFRNANKQPIDPDTITLMFKNPDDVTTTFVYGVDLEMIRTDVGMYYADIDAEIHGTWYYRWSATGVGQTAAESSFTVSKSLIVDG